MAEKCPAFGDGSDESNSLAGRLNTDLYRLTRDLPTLFGGEYKTDTFSTRGHLVG